MGKLQERLRLLDRIEAIGHPVTLRIARQISQAGLAAVKTGTAHVPTGPIVEQLADLMLLAFVKRYRMSRNDLELSFTHEVRKAARGLDLDLSGIGDSFTRNIRSRVQKSATHYEERINAALGRISEAQLPTRQATREMRRELAAMGLSPNNASLPESLVRSHSAMAMAAGQYAINKDDKHGLITGYTYYTVGDNRVRDEHALLDGKVFRVDDPVLSSIWPPNGWQCRCQLVEITDPIEASDELPASVISTATDGGEWAFSPGELLG